MSEIVVHVTTLDQWKSLLDVWFGLGYIWNAGGKVYHREYFHSGARYLFLTNEKKIMESPSDDGATYIEYSDFMAQQKKDNKMEIYYVTQKQLDLINDLKKRNWPLSALVNSNTVFRPLNNGLEMVEEKAILRYLGGDETIDFKAKKQLYRLWRIDEETDTVYMTFVHGTPDWTHNPELAFTAPLEEIKKWRTQAWDIEKAD